MHLPRHFFHFFHSRELNELYVSMAIRSFALSMIAIFIPIYLLQLQYSLSDVFLFFAECSVFHILFVFIAAKICSRQGIKHSIFYSILPLIVFFMLLYSLEQFNWPLWFLALFGGLNEVLFWFGYHLDFAKFSDKNHRGRELGFARIVTSVFQVAGPVVGGIILTLMGFSLLFVLVCIILFVSVVPLFYSKDIHNPINFSISNVFKGKKKRDVVALFGFGIETGAAKVVWPIFIFFTILGSSYTVLGSVFSISLLFSLLFVLIVGRFSDTSRRLVLKIGSIINAMVWILRSFVTTVFQVVIADSFYGVSQSLTYIPFDALSYDKANKSNLVQYTLFREISVQLGRIALFVGLALVSETVWGLYTAGAASLLHLLF